MNYLNNNCNLKNGTGKVYKKTFKNHFIELIWNTN